MSTSFFKTRVAARIRALMLGSIGLGACLLSVPGVAQTLSIYQWGEVMKETVPSQSGCFKAAYPNLQWQQTDSSLCHNVPSGQPQTGGSSPMAGYVSSADGSFLHVAGVTDIIDSGAWGDGAYSLQLNTNNFPLSNDSNNRFCNNASNCTG
ncbi:MAG: hypothetical protein LBU72_01675 [Burkholderiaceae bacterium]|jgi:hypothetical protein|nr:hypothetical protein [Burkholderiaceae bacterium]